MNSGKLQIFLLINLMLKIFTLLILLTFANVHAKVYYAVAMISGGARYHVNDLYDGQATKDRWGQLTPVGLRQQEKLGKIFRTIISPDKELLGDSFVKDEVTVFATTINSTIMSGMANLYGMYPLGTGQKLEPAQKKYRLPPFSTNTTDADEDEFALPQGLYIQPVSFSAALV